MKTMKTTFLIILLTLPLVLNSCGGNDGPATPITGEQFEKLRESKDNNGKRFSITGYPYLNSDVTIHNDLDVLVAFYSQPKAEGEYLGSIELGYKDEKNGMYLPTQFTPEDLKIFDNEGHKLGINDKITVSFTMKLVTNRPPSQGGTKMKKDEKGIPKIVETAPIYYGDGPTDIKIEKAQ